MKKSRIAILISGNGSNMEALIKAARNERFPAEIVGVLSDQASAKGLEKAHAFTIPTFVCERAAFPSKSDHEKAMLEILAHIAPDIICLAGYMRLMSSLMINAWEGRMLNIHPSLLPLFPGLNTHARALQAGVRIAGCSVHLVTQIMDAGPILAQAAVPVLESDNEDSLKARVLEAEHQLYPAALRQFILKKNSQNAHSSHQSDSEKQRLFSYG